jgi:predicted component of type VI protein secretion system
VVVLHHDARELVLLPGTYVIGRSRACQLIVSSDLVSRKHAELCVDLNGRVTLRDLKSHNGVSVNGHCLSVSGIDLKDGDRFKIGAESFTIHINSDALDSATMQVVEVVTEAAPTEVKHSAVASMAVTRATHDLDLICAVADRALAQGKLDEAEQLLSIHLHEVLHDAATAQQTSQAVRDVAFDYGLRLAELTHKQQWFDFAVDLLLAQGIVASPEQAEALLRVQKAFARLDTQRLDLYCRLVRRKPLTTENARVNTLLEAILERAEG